jgi:hypothetical protein
VSQLGVSYRLPLPVCEVLSAAHYGGALAGERNKLRDKTVIQRLRSGLSLLDLYPAAAANNIGARLTKTVANASLLTGNPSKTLIWLHVKGDRTKVGKSSANLAEANVISKVAANLLVAIRKAEAAEGITGGYHYDSLSSWGQDLEEEEEHDEEDTEDSGGEEVGEGGWARGRRISGLAARDADEDEDGSTSADECDYTASSFDEDDVLEAKFSALRIASEAAAAKEGQSAAAAVSSIAISEAEAVFTAQKRVEATNAGNRRMKLSVITPYEAQRSCITSTMCDVLSSSGDDADKKDGEDLASWVRASGTVGNVDALQGQEADVVLVSAVRAPPPGSGGGGGGGGGLGFLGDNRRVNVMLSRAQQLQVIVGDAEAWLLNGPKGSLLRSFAAKAIEENMCFGVVAGGGDFSTKTSLPRLVPVPGKEVLDGCLIGLTLETISPQRQEKVAQIWRAPVLDFVATPASRSSDPRMAKQPSSKQSQPNQPSAVVSKSKQRRSRSRAAAHTMNKKPAVAATAATRPGVQRHRTSEALPGSAALLRAILSVLQVERRKVLPGYRVLKLYPESSTRQCLVACKASGLRIEWKGPGKWFVGR